MPDLHLGEQPGFCMTVSIANAEAIGEFIVEASKRLEAMDVKLAHLENESDRLAVARARDELELMLKAVWEQFGGRWSN